MNYAKGRCSATSNTKKLQQKEGHYIHYKKILSNCFGEHQISDWWEQEEWQEKKKKPELESAYDIPGLRKLWVKDVTNLVHEKNLHKMMRLPMVQKKHGCRLQKFHCGLEIFGFPDNSKRKKG